MRGMWSEAIDNMRTTKWARKALNVVFTCVLYFTNYIYYLCVHILTLLEIKEDYIFL